MACQKTHRAHRLTGGGVRAVLRHITSAFLLTLAGCATVHVELAPTQECDPSWQGRDAQHIAENFNLHRGRWWDCYRRGQCYLALEFYQEAEKDFAHAIRVRDRDQWDARMYGMHFLDYFPHRERGIALYYQGMDSLSKEDRQDRQDRKDLLLQAIDDLKKSHRQQESSRAKFFLNEAQRAFWRGIDLTPPDVNVASLIYTKRSQGPVLVKAVDRESGVAAIHVMRLDGAPVTEHVFELAEKIESQEIQVPVDSLAGSADVLIIAADIVGNASEPHPVHIVMDTIAPTASIELRHRQDGRLSVAIDAVDDFALDRIIVGEANDTYDCLGEPNCFRVVHGTPKDHELAIRIVDRAGNETVSSVHVDETSAAALPGRSSQPLPGCMPPLEKRNTLWGQDRIVPFPCIDAPYAYLAWHAPGAWPAVRRNVSLDRVRGAVTSGGSTVRRGFYFPLHVCPKHGAKKTSQDVFYVDGTLYDADNVTRITVNGREIPNMIRRGTTRVFSDKVCLRDMAVGGTKEIEVKAFRRWVANGPEHLYDTKIITVEKVPNVTQPADARPGIVVLPFTFSSEVRCGSVRDDSILRDAYTRTVEALKGLRIPGSDQGRFRVDANTVIEPNSTLGDILGELQRRNGASADEVNDTDWVVCGELTRYCREDGDRFEIKLEAIDVSSSEYVWFPGGEGDITTRVLADVYGTVDKRPWYIELLAAKVGQRIPRLVAEVEVENWRGKATPCPRPAIIDRGCRHGVFSKMRLWVYERGDYNERNGSLGPRICRAEIRRVRSLTSEVRLLSDDPTACDRIVLGDVAVAK